MLSTLFYQHSQDCCLISFYILYNDNIGILILIPTGAEPAADLEDLLQKKWAAQILKLR